MYLSTIESKKQTKETITETESWTWRALSWCQIGGVCGSNAGGGEGFKKYK